jgi:hypothetical protein
MRPIRVFALAVLLIALIAPASASQACGKERWPVKVGEDQDIARVDPAAVPTTIFKLRQIGAPLNPAVRKDKRYKPTEFETFEINGQVTLIKLEADDDYHIVVKDTKGRTMIVESPDPKCASKSRFLKEITDVRNAIDSFFGGPIAGSQTAQSVYITASGIAFFDQIHGQTGVAPNGIELHPILDIHLRNTLKLPHNPSPH